MEFILDCPLLHLFAKLCKVAIVVNSKQKLGKVGCWLVAVFKVKEQLVHLHALNFELRFYGPKLLLELFVLHSLSTNFFE